MSPCLDKCFYSIHTRLLKAVGSFRMCFSCFVWAYLLDVITHILCPSRRTMLLMSLAGSNFLGCTPILLGVNV